MFPALWRSFPSISVNFQERRDCLFWTRRLPDGVAVFRAKGWGLKISFPPSKVSFPWVSREGTWYVLSIFQEVSESVAGTVPSGESPNFSWIPS